MRLFLPRINFCFFQRAESLKSCIKQPQLYLKSYNIEIKFNLEILFYTIFICKLQKIHFFKSSRPENSLEIYWKTLVLESHSL